jgi:hypothetical protein
MKSKFLVPVLMLSVVPSAFASKARLISLQKAAFIKDIQTTFVNPAHINTLDKQLTFEFGGSTNTSTPKAEGGIIDDSFGPKLGIYLGHVSDTQQTLRAFNGFENQNNSIDVIYGRDNWGFGLAVSNHKDKTADVEEKSATLRFGYDHNNTEFFGTVEAFATAESGKDEFKGGPQVELGFEKAIGTNYFFGVFNWGTAENEIANKKTDADRLGLEVGAISRRIQNIYYGVSVSYQTLELDKKIKSLTLPVFAGIEKDLNSWAVVRASVTQSVLISSYEDENQAPPADGKITNKNDTKVAAGIGLKHNNFTLDGVVSASTTGNVNGNEVLSQASLTYNF